MIIIGKNIRRFRQKLGWTQQKMGELLGISIPAVSKIELGVTDINIKRLHQIADILDRPVMDLMARDGKDSKSSYQDEIAQLEMKLLAKRQEIIGLQKQAIELQEELREKAIKKEASI